MRIYFFNCKLYEIWTQIKYSQWKFSIQIEMYCKCIIHIGFERFDKDILIICTDFMLKSYFVYKGLKCVINVISTCFVLLLLVCLQNKLKLHVWWCYISIRKHCSRWCVIQTLLSNILYLKKEPNLRLFWLLAFSKVKTFKMNNKHVVVVV